MASLTKWTCLLATALLLASCRSATASRPDASQAAEIDHGVRQMASLIVRDIAANGPNAWLGYFADEPGFFMASDGNLQFSSYEDARTFLGGYSSGVAHLELAWGRIRVDPLAPGLAVMASPYSEVVTDKQGRTRRFDGYFTGLAVKTRTGWKLRDAHWSSPASAH